MLCIKEQEKGINLQKDNEKLNDSYTCLLKSLSK